MMLLKLVILALAVVAAIGVPFAASAEDSIIPAGVELEVRLDDPIHSEAASPGDVFRAVVANSVEVEGETVIPSGTPARVEIVVDKHFAPGDVQVLAIELHSLQIDDHWYPVTTGFAELESGVKQVRAGPDEDVPSGTTDLDKIIAAPPHGENAALATVSGSGVTFHVLHGPELEADAGIKVYFTLAELLTLRPENRIR